MSDRQPSPSPTIIRRSPSPTIIRRSPSPTVGQSSSALTTAHISSKVLGISRRPPDASLILDSARQAGQIEFASLDKLATDGGRDFTSPETESSRQKKETPSSRAEVYATVFCECETRPSTRADRKTGWQNYSTNKQWRLSVRPTTASGVLWEQYPAGTEERLGINQAMLSMQSRLRDVVTPYTNEALRGQSASDDMVRQQLRKSARENINMFKQHRDPYFCTEETRELCNRRRIVVEDKLSVREVEDALSKAYMCKGTDCRKFGRLSPSQ